MRDQIIPRNLSAALLLGFVLATSLTVAQATEAAAAPASQFYQIKEGEDLYTVALLCQVPIATLRELNGMSSAEVNPGQRIQVPAGSLPATEQAAPIEESRKDENSIAPEPTVNTPVAVQAEAPAPVQVVEEVTAPAVAAIPPKIDPVVSPAIQETPKSEPAVVEIGSSREVLVAAWGTPKGFMKSGNSEVLTFEQNLVYLTGGKIVAITPRAAPRQPIRLAAH